MRSGHRATEGKKSEQIQRAGELPVRRGGWALSGWTVGVLAFLYLPIALLVLYSFNTSRLNVRWEGWTTRWYGEVFRSRELMEAAWHTVVIAAVVTVLSVPLGTLGAWLLHRYRFPFLRAINTLIFVPMIMPE